MLDDRTTRNPSHPQIEAGNYAKGHINVHGMRLSIENPAGSVRSGVDKSGEAWNSRLQHDYGYVRGTRGADKDHIDVFLGPEYKRRDLPVHVIDQHDPETGKFDEHKAMLGFPSQQEAMDAYHANYPADWAGARAVTPLHVDAFKAWATAPGARKTPLAGDASVDRDSSDLPSYAKGGSVAGFLSDPDTYKGLAKNLGALANRNLIGMAGMGPDVINWGLGKVGLGSEEPVGGSDWLKRKAAELGLATTSGNAEADNWGDAAAGLATANPAALAGVIGKGGRAVGRHAAGLVEDAMHGTGPLAGALAPVAPAFAVKPKGGNWAPDRLEGYVDQLGNGGWDSTGSVTQWKNKQLKNYLKNQLGTVDDPLLALEKQGRMHMAPEDLLELSAYRGVSPRTRQMGPGQPEMFPLQGGPSAQFNTRDLFHKDATGRNYRTPWENLSDGQIYKDTPAAVLQEMENQHAWVPEGGKPSTTFAQVADRLRGDGMDESGVAELAKQYGWLDKVDPKTPVWSLQDPGADPLGFNHVLDYLNAATAAHAGTLQHGGLEGLRAQHALYPNVGYDAGINLVERGLHLSPEQLGRTSVSDAVAKTSDWNKMMRELAEAKTAQAQAANPATVLHKAYEGTPYSWHQLKLPEPAAVDRVAMLGEDAHNPFAPPDSTLSAEAARKQLQDALTYEGDQMGHCVGGYCNEVARGGTSIYSLRDKAGKPAVTIETRPGTPAQRVNPLDRANNPEHSALGPQWTHINEDSGQLYSQGNAMDAQDMLRAQKGTPDRIIQIKGRFNGKPAEDTLPMVQDFIKSGNWGQIGDIENSGLIPRKDGKGYTSPQEIAAAAQTHLGSDPNFAADPRAVDYYRHVSRLDPAQLSDADNAFINAIHTDTPPPPEVPQYASGGRVSESAPGTQVLAPLGGWGWGYMNTAAPAAQSSAPAPDFTIPQVAPGGHTTVSRGDGELPTLSGNPGASAGTARDISNAASWAGLTAQLTKDPALGRVAGLVGAGADASAGQYGSLGSVLGRMLSNTPGASTVGSLVGQAASDGGVNGRNVANTVVSALPGLGAVYGAANFLSNGALGTSLFGTDVTPTASGGYTPAQPGVFGSWGRETTPAIEASNAAAAANNPDYSNEGLHSPAPTESSYNGMTGTEGNSGKSADDSGGGGGGGGGGDS